MNESKNLKSQWMKLCKRSRSKSRQIWVIDRDRDRDQESWINRDRDRDEKCDLTGTGTGIAQNCQSRSITDHDSDQELCKEQDCDTDEEDDDVENRLCAPVSVHSKDWCICGKCETLPEGEISYCCSDVGVVRDMMETENQCITEHSKFCNFILNRDALEMATYGHKTISYPDKDDQDSFHQLLRHTAYRSFLNLLEFHGLGKNNRYRLPACVIQSIRSKYPSISNEYVGFKESEFSSQSNGNTLQQF